MQLIRIAIEIAILQPNIGVTTRLDPSSATCLKKEEMNKIAHVFLQS
jgi:hypothetical protein